MPTSRTVLLADADVLIDYRDSELEILALVVEHVGRVAVLAPVLGEVRGVTAAQCVRLGIEVVEAETERMLQAADVESSVSFNDRLCLVVCREESWTCVTNDGALRRLCERHGVETKFGLGLMVDLVAAGSLTQRHAMAIARQIQASNPLHINERVLARFLAQRRPYWQTDADYLRIAHEHGPDRPLTEGVTDFATRAWLDVNRPDFRTCVADGLDRLAAHVRAHADDIVRDVAVGRPVLLVHSASL